VVAAAQAVHQFKKAGEPVTLLPLGIEGEQPLPRILVLSNTLADYYSRPFPQQLALNRRPSSTTNI